MWKKKAKFFKTLPVYLTANKNEKHVNLLMIETTYEKDEDLENKSNEVNNVKTPISEEKSEYYYNYVWIKHMSRLLSLQLSKRDGKKYFCDKCLHFFYTKKGWKNIPKTVLNKTTAKFGCLHQVII